MEYSLDTKDLDRIEDILREDIIELGVNCVFLIDLAGNIISSLDSGKKKHDVYALAALAAGNFGAVGAMADIMGEDYSILFHKGKEENIHFSKVMDNFLLVTTFSEEVSLGFLRMKVSEVHDKLREILAG